MKKTLLLITHSDISNKGGSIGKRIVPILEEANKKYNLIVFARGCDKDLKYKYNIYTIPAKIRFAIRSLTAINMYLDTPKLNYAKNKSLEIFFHNKLKTLNQKIDIVHSWDYFSNIYKYLKKQNPKVKIIQDIPIAFATILKDIDDKEKLWKGKKFVLPSYIRNTLPLVDEFIVPSKFTKLSLTQEGVNKNKIIIVPFGVDVKKFKPTIKKNKQFSIAFAGNVNNRKGVYYLLKAWKNLNLKNANLFLYGNVYPEVRQYLKEQKNVITPGFVDLTKELPKSHIYVFPSLLEGSSKSVYEAMACELPVITTINAGPIFKDKNEGFIIEAQNVKQIENKILYFYNNRKEINKFGKKARKLVTKFSWGNYAKNIIKNYN